MATQNIAPSAHSSSHKGVDSSLMNQKDGHSVTKRLQQDLMTLMVRVEPQQHVFPTLTSSIILQTACTPSLPHPTHIQDVR